MYNCGPTVYSDVHIGNLRCGYVFADVVRRVLEYNGFEVKQVRNITDVGHLTRDDVDQGEDKIEAAARRSGRNPYEISRAYTEKFWCDANRLNLLKPTAEPKATEYIPSMIRLIERLIDRGHAYPAETGVYFDVSTFPSYGNLSGNSVEDLIAGKRVEVDEGKRSPADFALWKSAGPDKLMRWESPWGWGVPGWHLECSAMVFDLLGEQIDIHTGGVDNLFPHHEDEIAQSEGATGKRFVNIWLHGEFLQLAGDEKMSKSKGNIYTVSDLVADGIHPLSYRYFTFQAHYRTKLSFNWDALEAAQTALCKLWELSAELTQSSDPAAKLAEAEPIRARFHDAINRDLDLPGAIAVLHEAMGEKKLPASQKLALLQDFDRVLGLDFLEIGRRLSSVTSEQRGLLDRRATARADKDWSEADSLRSRLAEMGLEVKDTSIGQRWVRRDLLRPRSLISGHYRQTGDSKRRNPPATMAAIAPMHAPAAAPASPNAGTAMPYIAPCTTSDGHVPNATR